MRNVRLLAYPQIHQKIFLSNIYTLQYHLYCEEQNAIILRLYDERLLSHTYFLDLDVSLTKQMEFTTFTCSGYLVKLGGKYRNTEIILQI